ncbi:MAG: SHOCT domain-containing protein [Desulfosporosinus sp.]|nr:SHOCT domain-containing protein [Desulfosporosinus sp.]
MGWGMMGNWGNMMDGYGGYGNGGYWGIGIMGMVLQLLMAIGVILIVAYFLRHRSLQIRSAGIMGRQTSGLDILRERYARGEIDSAEYQSRKQDLESR